MYLIHDVPTAGKLAVNSVLFMFVVNLKARVMFPLIFVPEHYFLMVLQPVFS